MARPRFYKNTTANVVKIYRVLMKAHSEDRGHITVGEIARECGLHKWTVSRTLDVWMSPFVEMVIPEELEDVGLKLKLVKIANPNVKEEQVVKSLASRI
jgi:hypothetical protein